MLQFSDSITKYPARASFAWYLTMIALGAVLLTLPICRAEGRDPISALDGVFTATSATCVTGLVVRSTGNDFSLVGQIVILLLIQLGGIGIMTVTTFITFGWTRRQGLRQRAVLTETLGTDEESNLGWVLRNVIGMTLLFEGVAFLILTIRNLFDEPPLQALWHALFHSISAFCNAGFSLFDDSLMRYQTDPIVNLTICALIICGGIGFPVMLDLRRNWHGEWSERWRRLHLHTKLMLIGTAGLILCGTISFLILEWDATLAEMPFGRRFLVALFHSVTARTAGFNTVDVGLLTNATLFVTILLMMIGAGPCSTGGGFKVSTFMTLVVRAWATLRGFVHINVFKRTVPRETTDRAVVTAFLFAVVTVIGLTGLLVFEQSAAPHPKSQGLFLDALFEVTSALGTVGLSTGMTTRLTNPGRIIIIVLMFVGRLGPISVVVAWSRGKQRQPVEMPTEEPLIG